MKTLVNLMLVHCYWPFQNLAIQRLNTFDSQVMSPVTQLKKVGPDGKA